MSETDTTSTSTVLDTERPSGRHPVNIGHLVMGIALIGLVGVWALIVGDVVEGADIRWLMPTPWVLGGAAGLIALAVTGHRGRESRRVGWVAPAEDAQSAEVIDNDTETNTDINTETNTETTTEENR
jgi:hypothetical protein